jgi:4a-hydroxytetrahydrobiopterin dehydratase
MADTILTESEASLAVEDLGWRYLLDCLTTAVTVDSLFDACEVIRAAVDIAGPHANDHLRLHATADLVELTLATRGKFRVTTQDVDLARSITKAVRTAGYQTVAHPAHHSVSRLQSRSMRWTSPQCARSGRRYSGMTTSLPPPI